MLARNPHSHAGAGRETVQELLKILGVEKNEQQLLLWRYQDALSCNRIADKLNVSRNDVEKKLLNARKTLREKLNSHLS